MRLLCWGTNVVGLSSVTEMNYTGQLQFYMLTQSYVQFTFLDAIMQQLFSPSLLGTQLLDAFSFCSFVVQWWSVLQVFIWYFNCEREKDVRCLLYLGEAVVLLADILSLLQLRESISQDQEKTESVKSQMQELEKNIQDVDAKIHHAETLLKDVRKLQDQISTKTAERSTLFKEQQKQYAALAEENEGQF